MWLGTSGVFNCDGGDAEMMKDIDLDWALVVMILLVFWIVMHVTA